MKKNNIKKNLYILADSMATDTYINIITYCVKEFNIQKIGLLHIYNQEIGDAKDGLSGRIVSQLKNILKGDYNLYNNKTGTYIMEKLDNWDNVRLDNYKQAYSIMTKNIEEKKIELNKFYGFLSELNGKNDYIFDITTLKKDTLTNIIPLFLEKNISDIFYFEKSTKWNHNQQDLIHNLKFSEIKYEKILTDETVDRLKKIRKDSLKSIIIYCGILGIAIILFIMFTLGKGSQMMGIIGTVISALSLILYILDNRK